LDGAATDAEITTDIGVSSGDVVLAGTSIELTACGDGAAYYEYEWNDEFYTLNDTLSILVTDTVNLECVVIGYMPGSKPMTYSITVTLNLDDCPVSSERDVTLNGEIPLAFDESGQHKGYAASGTYSVYVNGIDTGITVMVRHSGANEATVDFYSLTVEAGDGIEFCSGSGEYMEGAIVSVSATLLDGISFKEWIADDEAYTGAPCSPGGNIMMPGHALTLTATGLDNSEGLSDINPIQDTSDTLFGSTNGAPKTGDYSNIHAWWVMLLTSVLGIAGMLIWRRSRKELDAH